MHAGYRGQISKATQAYLENDRVTDVNVKLCNNLNTILVKFMINGIIMMTVSGPEFQFTEHCRSTSALN